ncbi:MAG: elongation factor G [Nitrospirota bacterium]|jgi:elongation factor G
MPNFAIDKLRDIAVVAHSKAGKTSLVEAVLFDAGAVDRLGSVQEGTATTDYEPEAVDRQMTVTSTLAFCTWKDTRLNIIDTPGFINLLEDSRGGMRAADGALLVGSSIGGVKGEAERLWQYTEEFALPRLVFINKMDRDSADFYAAAEAFEKTFQLEAVPLHLPIGTGEGFSGVVDLLGMKAYTFAGGKPSECGVPGDMEERVQAYRKKLVEKVAELDDALLEKYLEGAELTAEELLTGVRKGSLERRFIPVTCGSALKNVGIQTLLDAVLLCLPSPQDMAGLRPLAGTDPRDGSEVVRDISPDEHFSAFVFKTIADPFAGKLSLFRVCSGTLTGETNVVNTVTGAKERLGQAFYLLGKKQVSAQNLGPGEIAAVAKLKETNTGDTLADAAHPVIYKKVDFAEPLITYAIEAKSKGEEEKVSTALHKVLDEDPTIHFSRDEEANEMLLSGMGQFHLELTLEKLKRKFGVDVLMKAPQVPYRETISASAKAQGKYKKQSGGRGQYGDCWIEIEPLPRGTGYEFVDKIVGGAIPRQYIPAVDKGIQEAMRQGLYAGFPMVDVRVTLYDGSFHAVDSSEMAFKIAGSLGIKKAVAQARPVVLEPVMKVEITTPEEYLGTIIGDLNSRRGKVQGMEQLPGGTNQKVGALVPMAEMLTYANQLHSITSGRGLYNMEFSHYEELPHHLVQKLLEEKKKVEAEEVK